MITVIIPIDLKSRPKDVINKAISITEKAEKTDFKIIFGHNDRNKRQDKKFKEKLNNYVNTSVVSTYVDSDDINMSRLRNIAFQQVETEYLLLLDVDINFNENLFVKYLNKLKNNEGAFFIIPCLYLTKYGSHILHKTNDNYVLNRFFSFSRKEFLHLASPSSITLLKTQDYKILNGFDEQFSGHGFEDFDFLTRLSNLYNLLPKSDDFIANKTARSPLFSVGFRKYLGALCLDALIEKDIALHKHHRKEKKSPYYFRRDINFNIFKNKHKKTHEETINSQPTLLIDFMRICSVKNIDITDYSVLFDNRPGHIDRYDTFLRKLRFILK
ncbi:galactosyltransferase-related protein [Pantoea sp. SOD02]|uniref:galactosyltransferase-related protein n=1 Tax=Pantoea sp. SOD02 TaxID=2970818 RepID=UPI0021576058|nr:galactosyltransferase-related protein [Pantoea sp. SOD02]UVC28647.1 galactosyltransferase-related protein [Pantoea sp. SOD02]